MNTFGKIFWTLFPIVSLVLSFIALQRAKKYKSITNQIYWGLLILISVFCVGFLVAFWCMETGFKLG